jgi:glycosidase
MRLILDGVPNHLSSDAFIFDRFQRHPGEGACESVDSPYRDWFFFNPAAVEGSGACDGDANFEAWAGIVTLPQLDTTHPEVIAEWLDPEDGVAVRWLNIPGIEGWRIDVVPDVAALNPDYFSLFRQAVKAAHPEAQLYSETWQEHDVRQRVLGNEFDSTMNYRFRDAILGFLRDTDWSDGDGIIPALSASQFEASLRTIQEDYPEPAFATAMNLLSSHDVNRPVRVLDHDPVDHRNLVPANDFADGRARLRLASVLQFTLPGAPTVYYGDEVGLVGFGSEADRDDPYNRQPYPWPDEPGYDDLPAWRQQQTDLLAHYQFLGQLRGAHSFLRTGEWITFAADDESGLYAFGRKDATGAAVIAVNRGAEPTAVDLNLTGFVPLGATLVNALSGEEATTPLAAEVAAMDFAIWIAEPATDLSVPPAPAIRDAGAGEGSVTLTIEVTDEETTGVRVWRSVVDGGYQAVAQLNVDGPGSVTYAEADLPNGQPIFYRVSGLKASGMESAASPSQMLIPQLQIDEARLVAPQSMAHVISAITPTQPVQLWVVVEGVTGGAQPAAGIVAELGLLPQGEGRLLWSRASYVGSQDGGDLYAATLLPSAVGDYSYGWRISTDGGRTWSYVDTAGVVPALPWSAPGELAVIPSEDTDPPNRPFRIDEIFASPNQISLEWRLSRTPDLHEYRLCRQNLTLGESDPCATVFTVPAADLNRAYTDTAVIRDHVYRYQVQSVDTSLNRSEFSPAIEVTAAEVFVEVTFRVRVPPFTPGEDLVYIAGNDRAVFNGSWDPAAQPMTPGDEPGIWEYTVTVKDGTPINYKYSRGSWEMVEQWGAMTGLANRAGEIVATGDTLLIDDTAAAITEETPIDRGAIQNWRDPLVVGVVMEGAEARVTFNNPVVAIGDLAGVVVVTSADGVAIPGTVAQVTERVFTFTGAGAIPDGATVTVFNVATDTPMARPFVLTMGE